MQRYFIKETGFNKNTVTLNKDDSHHIKNVMRMNIDDKIEVVANKKLYLCQIIDIDEYVHIKTIEILPNDHNELPCQITIAQTLVNEQKMDLILQKNCELGVSSIIPLNTSRSIVNISQKEVKKLIRWNKILKEASEQSKRTTIPQIHNIMSIPDLLDLDYDYKILCTVNEMTTNIKKSLSNVKKGDRILFVIGPEGGFTKDEEQLLMDNNFIPISFGKRVLRTETASIYIMSIMNYILME